MEKEEDEVAQATAEALKDRKKADKKKEVERKEAMEADGMDLFFSRNESFITADEGEYEGHYPGNQNNAILVPKKKGIVHAS